MIESTTYNASNPTKVIVHGWLGNTQEKSGVCSYNVHCKFVSIVIDFSSHIIELLLNIIHNLPINSMSRIL